MKKWSYVAVALMIAGSGMALTSCIDNDEPFGIEQIRLATANLLDAKKAALEAEAAAKSAQVEIAKINAEMEKLRIENEKIKAQADADYRAAEAKYLEAQAEAEKLKAQGQNAKDLAEAQKLQAEAEKWKAEAESIKSDAQARLDEANQRIERAKQDAENAQRTADLEYEKALYAFEKGKAQDANTANSSLWTLVENAFNTYLQKISAYNLANKDYMHALNQMYEIEADLIWKEGYYDGDTNQYIYGHFESPIYGKKKDLENLVASKERDIAKYERVVTIYDEFMAKLDAFNEGDWAQLLAEYQEKLADAEVAVVQAQMEQEAVKVDQKEVYDAPVQAQQELIAFESQDIEIAPFTVDPIDRLAILNSQFAAPIEIVPENQTYKVYDSYPVAYYESAYNYWIKQFTKALFDDNDEAWTKARLAELKRQADNDQPYNDAKALWEMAKKAYNMGGVPDASVLPLADEVEAAVAAYNAIESKVKDAKDAQDAADQAVDDTNQEWQDLLTSYYNGELPGALATYMAAQEANTEALKNARDTRDEAYSTLWNECVNTRRQIDNKVQTLINNLTIADNNYAAAQKAADANPKDEALAKAAAAALTEVKKAEKAYSDYTESSYDEETGYVPSKEQQDRDAAWTAYNDGCDLATYAYNKAVAEADNALLKAHDAYLAAGGQPEKDPAYKAVADAEAAYNAALETQQEAADAIQAVIDEVQPLIEALDNAVDDQQTAMKYNWRYYTPSTWQVWNYVYGGTEDFPTAVAPVMYLNNDQVYENAKQFVIDSSEAAYGWIPNYDTNWDWQADQAFLIDEVTVETLNMYITKMMMYRWNWEEKDITPFDIKQQYGNFGLFGQMTEVLYQISCAEICLNDGNNAITVQIDKLTAARDEMLDNDQAKQEEWKELQDKYNEANEALTALENQAQDAVDDAVYYQRVYGNIVNTLKPYVNIQDYNEFKDFYDGEFGKTSEAIKAELKREMKDNEDLLIKAQDALDYYNYMLAQLESDEYAKVENPWAYEVEYLKQHVAECEEAMNFAKAHYEELQAKYNALNKQ